jgi:hypothetical protein
MLLSTFEKIGIKDLIMEIVKNRSKNTIVLLRKSRIMLTAEHNWGLMGQLSILKTNFTRGIKGRNLKIILEGMNEDKDHFIQLSKTIYVFVQSAREFYLKSILVLKSMVLWKINDICVCSLVGTGKKSFSSALMSMNAL